MRQLITIDLIQESAYSQIELISKIRKEKCCPQIFLSLFWIKNSLLIGSEKSFRWKPSLHYFAK